MLRNIATTRWTRPVREITGAGRPAALLTFIALGFGAVEAARFIALATPWLEGADLYYYLAVSRDMANGASDVHPVRHSYFPGVYAFWRTVIRAFGLSWPVIKLAGLALLLANSVLIATLTMRVGGGPAPAAYAALFYFALASRLEGFMGPTEPLATIPLLAGLAIWAGIPLRARKGWRGTFALGCGVGLSVYMKQQAGLLALGAVALLPGLVTGRTEERHSLSQVAALPLISALVMVAGILLEREGLKPLTSGILAAATYERTGTALANLNGVWTRAGAGGVVVCVVAALCWVAVQVVPRFERLRSEAWFRVGGFALVAAIATLLQFRVRPYLHYALLTAAVAVPGAVIVLHGTVRRVGRRATVSTLIALLSAILLAGPFIRPRVASSAAFYLLPPRFGSPVGFSGIWRAQPAVTRDLRVLSEFVQPGEDALVLPPSKNEVHLALGTRSKSFGLGYGWAPANAAMALDSPSLRAVVIVKTGFNASDSVGWSNTNSQEAASLLESAGFVLIRDLETLAVWRRREQ